MFERHSLGWRGIMPHYHKYPWEGFNIKAEPIGMRRCRFLRFIPYITGNKPKIHVVVKVAEGENRELEVRLFLNEPMGLTKQTWKFLSHPDKQTKNIDEKLMLHPIAISGNHRLQAQLHLPRTPIPESLKYDLVTFRAIAQEMMIGWTIGALLMLGAVVVGILNLICRL